MDLHYTRHEFNIKLLNFLLEKQDFTNGGNESAKTTKTVTAYHRKLLLEIELVFERGGDKKLYVCIKVCQ